MPGCLCVGSNVAITRSYNQSVIADGLGQTENGGTSEEWVPVVAEHKALTESARAVHGSDAAVDGVDLVECDFPPSRFSIRSAFFRALLSPKGSASCAVCGRVALKSSMKHYGGGDWCCNEAELAEYASRLAY